MRGPRRWNDHAVSTYDTAVKLQQADIHSYTIFEKADDVGGADERAIRAHIRSGTDVTSGRHDDKKWWLTTNAGEESVDVLGRVMNLSDAQAALLDFCVCLGRRAAARKRA